jgi:DNA modification methylase
MLVPSLFALSMKKRGWILRNDIIWKKRNYLPSGTKSNLTSSYEHIFHFTKIKTGYYYDLDSIRVQCADVSFKRMKHNKKLIQEHGKAYTENNKLATVKKSHDSNNVNVKSEEEVDKILESMKKGKNPGNYCETSGEINTIYTAVGTKRKGISQHIAPFPMELIEPFILVGSPKEGFVLDPYTGGGTTGIVAIQNQRRFMGFEVVPEFHQYAMDSIKNYEYEPYETYIPKLDIFPDSSKVDRIKKELDVYKRLSKNTISLFE